MAEDCSYQFIHNEVMLLHFCSNYFSYLDLRLFWPNVSTSISEDVFVIFSLCPAIWHTVFVIFR